MKATGASYRQTDTHFGMSEIGMIANWNATVLEEGVEAFFRQKGRPQNSMTTSKASKATKTLTREQQL